MTMWTTGATFDANGCSPESRVSQSRPTSNLLARCAAWLRRVTDAQRLSELEPRIARDIGAAECPDRYPKGFAVDPRPLWGIGLTPMPMDTLPPWKAGRGKAGRSG
jgi:hypothetical protein